jgi:TonB-dependent SusC/RagA subfamily outer membrane receptor
MNKITAIFVLFNCLALFNCKTSQTTTTAHNANGNTNTKAVSEIETPNSTMSLLDYLRRIPGIQISGPKNDPVISIRNAVSGGQTDISPLFVIDNRPVGNNYPLVSSMIDVNDIKSVTVLKDVSSTSEYGLQGANGVIVIHTKKDGNK